MTKYSIHLEGLLIPSSFFIIMYFFRHSKPENKELFGGGLEHFILKEVLVFANQHLAIIYFSIA